MKNARWLFLTLLLAMCLPFVAINASASEADLPLDVYQKFKAHFDVLVAGKSNAESEEKALRADAVAQKDVLIRALKAEKPVQRRLAVMALEYCGDKKAAVAALVPLLNGGDSDASVRRAATVVLGRLPDAGAVDALISELSDDDENVRGSAALALGNINDSRAVAPLVSRIKNEAKPIARLQAALALGKLKDASAIEALKAALDTETDERVKMAIASALRATTGGDDEKTSPVPSVGDAASEIAALAHEMKDVEQKLREDRHDQAVLVQGKGIEDKLAALILKLDKG